MIAGCDGRGVSSQLPEAPLPGETSAAPSEQPETAPSAQPETAPSEQATDASSVVEVDDEVAETITREEWLDLGWYGEGDPPAPEAMVREIRPEEANAVYVECASTNGASRRF